MADLMYFPSENPPGALNPSSKLRLECRATADIVTNTSTVTIKLQAYTEADAGTWEPKGKIVINGVEYVDTDDTANISSYGKWFDMWNKTAVVPHNDEGDGVLTIQVLPTGERDTYCLVRGGIIGYKLQNAVFTMEMPKINTGLVHIDNGQTFEKYMIYVDNGTGWDKAVAYVDDGSQFNRCV